VDAARRQASGSWGTGVTSTLASTCEVIEPMRADRSTLGDGERPPPSSGASGRGRRLRGLVLTAAAVLTLVLLERRSLEAAVGRLGGLSPPWIAAAVVAEAVSYLAAAELQRQLLAGGGLHLRRRSLIELAWATSAVSSVFPAGPAVGTAYSFRHLTRRGATGGLVGWVLAATGVLSGAALVALVLIGAELREASAACTVLLTTLAVVIVAIVAATIVGLAASGPLACRLETACRRAAARARRLTRRPALAPLTAAPAPRLRMGRAQWSGAFSLAAVNWVADAVALAFSLLALGVALPLRGLLFAYAVSQVASTLPITPGSIGIAEGSMALALICAGVRAPDALAATLAYRLVTYWLQLLPGGIAWLTLGRSLPTSTAAVTASARLGLGAS
jgi:uncharacterized membrane protein YbhN (UPF0104 family)